MRFIAFLFLCSCATAVADGDGGTDDDSGTGTKDSATMLDGAQQADTMTGMDTSMGTCASTFSGVLATWDFTMEAGNQTSTVVKTTASNVTGSAFSRSMGLTATAGAGSINSSNWPTAGALDPMKYYTFTITPPAGCSLDITQLSIDSKRSTTGPLNGAVATSADNFSAATTVGIDTVAMILPNVKGQTKAVEIRVYGFGASASGGTLRIQNTFTVTGELK